MAARHVSCRGITVLVSAERVAITASSLLRYFSVIEKLFTSCQLPFNPSHSTRSSHQFFFHSFCRQMQPVRAAAVMETEAGIHPCVIFSLTFMFKGKKKNKQLGRRPTEVRIEANLGCTGSTRSKHLACRSRTGCRASRQSAFAPDAAPCASCRRLRRW